MFTGRTSLLRCIAPLHTFDVHLRLALPHADLLEGAPDPAAGKAPASQEAKKDAPDQPQHSSTAPAAAAKPVGSIKVLRAAKPAGAALAVGAPGAASGKASSSMAGTPVGTARPTVSTTLTAAAAPACERVQSHGPSGDSDGAEGGVEAASIRTARQLLARLPIDAEDAEGRYASLLYDSLDDVSGLSWKSQFGTHCRGLSSH